MTVEAADSVEGPDEEDEWEPRRESGEDEGEDVVDEASELEKQNDS